METNKKDVEKLLLKGESIWLKPQGSSMYPLIIEGRDSVHIVPFDGKGRVNDILLFRRKGSILVLHRVIKKDREGLYFIGDNQYVIEGPVKSEMVLGKVDKVYRNGRYISTGNLFYRFLTGAWLLICPLRPAVHKVLRFFRGRL